MEHRQRMGPLNFVTGAHTAGAGNTGCIVQGEKGIGSIDDIQPVGGLRIPHLSEPERLGQPLQGFRSPIPRRLFGHIEFEDVPSEPIQPLALRVDHHALADRSRAGGRQATLALNLAETEPAGAERRQMVRRAESRNDNPGFFCRAVNRVARRRQHQTPINFQLHAGGSVSRRSSLVAREQRFTRDVSHFTNNASRPQLAPELGECSIAVSTG